MKPNDVSTVKTYLYNVELLARLDGVWVGLETMGAKVLVWIHRTASHGLLWNPMNDYQSSWIRRVDGMPDNGEAYHPNTFKMSKALVFLDEIPEVRCLLLRLKIKSPQSSVFNIMFDEDPNVKGKDKILSVIYG